MDLRELGRHWNRFGERDPLWAVLTDPRKAGGKWDPAEFFETGVREIDAAVGEGRGLGLPAGRRKALDFGCGVGRLTQAMCRHFDECRRVDIAPSMVREAERFNRFGDRCRYAVNPRDDLSLFADGEFDFVYSNIVLQHMRPEYSRKYIQEFVRVLGPGGLLIFQVPDHHAPGGAAGGGAAASGGPSAGRGAYVAVRAVAKALLNGAARLLGRGPVRPTIEMYAVPRAEVQGLVERAGGRVVRVTPDMAAGEHWPGFRYFVTRANRPMT